MVQDSTPADTAEVTDDLVHDRLQGLRLLAEMPLLIEGGRRPLQGCLAGGQVLSQAVPRNRQVA